MKRLAVVAVLLLMRCSSSVAQQTKDSVSMQAVPLCAVIADAAKYDGKEIVVRGLYRMVIHGTIVMDRACSKTDVSLREAAGYKADKQASALPGSLTKKNQFQPVEVVFRGIFHVAHQGQCFGQICAAYEIETTELVMAQPAPPEHANATGTEGLSHEADHAQGIFQTSASAQTHPDLSEPISAKWLGRLMGTTERCCRSKESSFPANTLRCCAVHRANPKRGFIEVIAHSKHTTIRVRPEEYTLGEPPGESLLERLKGFGVVVETLPHVSSQ